MLSFNDCFEPYIEKYWDSEGISGDYDLTINFYVSSNHQISDLGEISTENISFEDGVGSFLLDFDGSLTTSEGYLLETSFFATENLYLSIETTSDGSLVNTIITFNAIGYSIWARNAEYVYYPKAESLMEGTTVNSILSAQSGVDFTDSSEIAFLV